ncbi:MAG: metallophosphoesterase family protein [Coriobacteriia bacterium]
MLIGILSDTHGVVPVTLHEAFAGVRHIVHAGDIGGEAVLAELESIAPVLAVRGNTDRDALGWRLPERLNVRLGGVRMLVGHVEQRVVGAGVPADVSVVVTGHTHIPRVTRRDGVIHVNPGAAGGAARGGHGPTAAVLDTAVDGLSVSILDL